MKVTRKPKAIEAMQFTNETKEAVYYWASKIQKGITISGTGSDNVPCLNIPTDISNDYYTCKFGDWLIFDTSGNVARSLIVCPERAFLDEYDLVDKKEETVL